MTRVWLYKGDRKKQASRRRKGGGVAARGTRLDKIRLTREECVCLLFRTAQLISGNVKEMLLHILSAG